MNVSILYNIKEKIYMNNKSSINTNVTHDENVLHDKSKSNIVFDKTIRDAFKSAVEAIMDVKDDMVNITIDGVTRSAKVSKKRVTVTLAVFSNLITSHPNLVRGVNFIGLLNILYMQVNSLPPEIYPTFPIAIKAYGYDLTCLEWETLDEFQWIIITLLIEGNIQFNELLLWGKLMSDYIYQLSPDYASVINTAMKMFGVSRKVFTDAFIYVEQKQAQTDKTYSDLLGQFSSAVDTNTSQSTDSAVNLDTYAVDVNGNLVNDKTEEIASTSAPKRTKKSRTSK